MRFIVVIALVCTNNFAEVIHGGTASENSNVFDTVGKGSQSSDAGKKLKSCQITCGPNKDRFILHYFCIANEGRIVQHGKELATLPGCRNETDIVCGNRTTGFTLDRTANFGKARGDYKSAPMGGFRCEVKEE